MLIETPEGWTVQDENGKTLGGPYPEEEARRRAHSYLAKRTAFPDTDFDTLTKD